ncbi:Brix domain-containing protein [Scheffersomyces xylosifermentans]|uniref:Brix domain-containing protein n=1 Tax=Scheffersomyces xylosifermentans TaxID=1304137 RepID=UPI00315D7EDC
MAKRRTKTRTHKKVSEEELAKIPRSMVLRLGSSLRNHSLSQLVKDFRIVMQPHTAINLRERKSNKLKDFIVMAGPLGVSDMFIFNQSEETGSISLRIGKMPRGPTLQFRVNTYSLIKDVRRILKHPKSVGKDSAEFANPPLLVLNGFSNKLTEAENHEKLMITVFQNMFPPIQPQSTRVSSIKRVLMINKNPETNEIDLRHYAINTKLVEENRNVKKLINSHHNLKKNLPNLSNNRDVSELLLDPYSVGGITSDSEVEDDAIVEIKNEEAASNLKKKATKEEPEASNAQATRKRAIKLTELGPRINMSLMKIEEGLTGSSKTLYHAQITKTQAEQKALNKKHELRQKLKAERRAQQQAALKAKNAVKEEKKARRKARQNGEDGDVKKADEDESMDEEEEDSDAPIINAEDYENDSDLYSDIEK